MLPTYLCSFHQRADSYTFNPHKWMLVHFDCSALWYAEQPLRY
jgi:glutamate/tyrosine decarboxylase-like PLP-dependent enzyme